MFVFCLGGGPKSMTQCQSLTKLDRMRQLSKSRGNTHNSHNFQIGGMLAEDGVSLSVDSDILARADYD